MAKDTEKTNETVANDKITFATRARTFWDNNKNKLFWFGVGTLTGAGTVIGTALLLEPSEEQYAGDNEETVALDITSEAVPS
jgi:hypothetical protein